MINVGKYINTHGIKGEIRILSTFSRKDLAFFIGNKIYIGNEEFEIINYRIHKNYDMVMLKGINDINQIEHLKGSNVYIENKKENFLIENLLEYNVVIDGIEIGIKEIIENKKYKILVLRNNKMIPYIDNFIEKIDYTKKIVYVREGMGL